MAFFYSTRARLALLDNDLSSAEHLIKLADMNFDSGNMHYNLELPRLTYCAVLLAHDSPSKTKEAIQKLEEFGHIAEKTRNVPQLIRANIFRAIAYKKINDQGKAKEFLVRSLELAQPGRWIYPFKEAGQELLEMLNVSGINDELKDFTAELTSELSAMNTRVRNDLSQKTNTYGLYEIDPLTYRETDVLILLAERMSNKEIANKLYISESTVKRHTINIYQKLNVHKRSEAVARAKSLGIIR